MNAGPGGLVVEVVGAAAVTAVGSLFAAGDAALSEIPEGRMQALSATTTGPGAAFRRYTTDPLRILSRWLVGRVVALSVATVLLEPGCPPGRARRAWRCPSPSSGRSSPTAPSPRSSARSPAADPSASARWRSPSSARSSGCSCPWPIRSSIVGRAVGRRVPKARTVDARITETEVEWVVSEGEKAGAIANEPAEMIRKVLDFKDLTAREVMVPRRKILGIEVSTPLAEVVALVAREKHSRYPVYRETLDNIVGQLYAKDLFALVRDGQLDTHHARRRRARAGHVRQREPVGREDPAGHARRSACTWPSSATSSAGRRAS